MYVVGTVNHYLYLISKYLDYFEENEHKWTLKEFGYFFVKDTLDKINSKEKIRILEIGPGYSNGFLKFVNKNVEYWCIDKEFSRTGINFDKEKYIKFKNEREKLGGKFVNAFMGEFSKELPENYFDLVFSVSVLEHINVDNLDSVIKDIKRVLKKGGISCHSIDVIPGSNSYKSYLAFHRRNNFEIRNPFYFKINLKGENTVFLESQRGVFLCYGGKRNEPYKNPKKFTHHSATFLLRAIKK